MAGLGFTIPLAGFHLEKICGNNANFALHKRLYTKRQQQSFLFQICFIGFIVVSLFHDSKASDGPIGIFSTL
jgi:hypothetical protein